MENKDSLVLDSKSQRESELELCGRMLPTRPQWRLAWIFSFCVGRWSASATDPVCGVGAMRHSTVRS